MFCLLVFLIFIALIIGLTWHIYRRREKDKNLKAAEVGTIIDRALWSYRQHMLLLLILSAVCLPLGNLYGYQFLYLSSNPVLDSPRLPGVSADLASILFMIFGICGVTGIGKTLLLCGIAQAFLHHPEGEPIRLRDAFPRQRLWTMAGIVVLMIIPSLINGFFSILGGLVSLYWSLVPVVILSESQGPLKAFKRSYQIVQQEFSGLLNTVVILWFIGWIIVFALVYGTLFIVQLLVELPPSFVTGWLFAGWVGGSVFTAPLTALGTFQFYQCARERVVETDQRRRSWTGYMLLAGVLFLVVALWVIGTLFF